jgi:hypothetical protein
MKLIKELSSIEPSKEFVELLEDMGNLRDLGVGKMVNVFKQEFRKYASRPGQLTTGSVGKTFNKDWKVGKNSKVEKMGTLVSAMALRNAWKNFDYSKPSRAIPAAAVLYLRHRPIAMIVGTDMAQLNDVVGLSWDFDSQSNEEKVVDTLAGLPLDKELKKVVPGPEKWERTDADTQKRVPVEPKVVVSKQSRHEKNAGESTHHYEGVAITVKDMMEFLRRLIRNFGASSITWKLIFSDTKRKSAAKMDIRSEMAKRFENDHERETVEENEEEGEDLGPVEAYGVKGMKSIPWRKIFKNSEALNKWVEANDAEVHGTRKPPDMPSKKF